MAVDQPDFVYGGAEITRWYNDGRPIEQRITLQEGRQVARYFNAAVWARLAAYLRAVQRAELVWRWSGVAQCESGGNWSANTGNGYYGGLQFLSSTWRAVGGAGYPHQHPAYEQAYRAEILKNRAGLGQWPHCGRYYR